jgi:putative Holliday junction resolvase
MGRILAIDYGKKRTGIAVTDPLKIIASPLDTVPTESLLPFLKQYLMGEEVEVMVLGLPVDLNNQETHATAEVNDLVKTLKETFPLVSIRTIDERYTSKMAMDAMISGGMKKKDRANKGNIDKISAAIILQSFLAQNS